ncbi:hypothetical protein Maes01_00968 [Microbulbifer aestuariivivens]|uniref:ATP-grasp domain-containing protein n=1 Tax=Microbulbifer aestuariivivens TaxID=1908308 RepID=A0ABP9WQL9_9GAMM
MNKKNVLIIAPYDDAHAIAVKDRISQLYQQNVECTVFDIATYPIASSINWLLDKESCEIDLGISPPLAGSIGASAGKLLDKIRTDIGQHTRRVSSDSITGVWWRRPRAVEIHPEVTADEIHTFCSRTATSVSQALFSALPTYNNIDREEEADRKPYQIWMAKKHGLMVPETIISSDKKLIEGFANKLWKQGKQIVYKHAASATSLGIPTRLLTSFDIQRMGHEIKFAPTTFQERITGGTDLRIAVIGNSIFSSEWRSHEGDFDSVDIRMEEGVRMWPCKCPKSIESKILQLHKALGLTFGVYDFKVNGEGTPYFLEVNPSGQWLDMELESEHPISEAWARLLVEGPEHRYATSLEPLTMSHFSTVSAPYLSHRIPTEWNRVI